MWIGWPNALAASDRVLLAASLCRAVSRNGMLRGFSGAHGRGAHCAFRILGRGVSGSAVHWDALFRCAQRGCVQEQPVPRPEPLPGSCSRPGPDRWPRSWTRLRGRAEPRRCHRPGDCGHAESRRCASSLGPRLRRHGDLRRFGCGRLLPGRATPRTPRGPGPAALQLQVVLRVLWHDASLCDCWSWHAAQCRYTLGCWSCIGFHRLCCARYQWCTCEPSGYLGNGAQWKMPLGARPCLLGSPAACRDCGRADSGRLLQHSRQRADIFTAERRL
mmetsp:Transcript_110654/g.263823  ORF Transcript_110654/g.263823 Transcript_110654/m.263823 type:complete len:274 (+) Transcript_110654:303-1124(+)